MLSFPLLSRKPDPEYRIRTVDPTLRDPMESGDTDTGLRFSRGRRELEVHFKYLRKEDLDLLEDFVRNQVAYGSLPFTFVDDSHPGQTVTWTVKFSKLPEYDRTEQIQDPAVQPPPDPGSSVLPPVIQESSGRNRFHCSFTLREE